MEDTTAKPFPIIDTGRLLLREFAEADAGGLMAVTQDPEVMKYYGMGPCDDEQAAHKEIAWFRGLFSAGEGIRWCVTAKPDSGYIGDIGFFKYEPAHGRAEIGFKLAKSYWRQGLTAEMFPPVLQYGFADMGLHRIEALVDPRNTPCCRLLEKFRFTCEGILRDYEYEHGDYVDLAMYSLLQGEWEGYG